VANGPCLWPPNHKFYSLEDFLNSDYITATNRDCPIRYISYVKCTQVESSGSEDDTDTCNYHESDDVLCVLAERSGSSKNGRIYNIVLKVNVTCADTLQQVTFTITVPHDARGGAAKSCKSGGKGNCTDQPPPPKPVVWNEGRITTSEVSTVYDLKKEQILSNTNDTLIENNVMAGNNPVNVESLGGHSDQSEEMFQYEIILSQSVDNSVISLMRDTQSQVFSLPVDRFTISASRKRQSKSTYIVTVSTDGLSSGAMAGIVIACVVVVGVFIGIIYNYRIHHSKSYAPIK